MRLRASHEWPPRVAAILPAHTLIRGSTAKKLPEIVTLARESSADIGYDNHPLALINNHVVRIATMTGPYGWHFHPNSDETFLVIEGRLLIEFEEGSLELGPGQLVTVPLGVRHCTRPVGNRSVNLTFELREMETIAV